MGVILWNGVSSEDVNVIVERYPSRTLSGRAQTSQNIPGRNGSILLAEESFNNSLQEYEIYISAKNDKLPNISRAVASWLYSGKGYKRLEDSYDMETYRMAAFTGPLNIENLFNEFGRSKISFNCKPQRFFKTGETELTLVKHYDLINPTVFEAEPLITLEVTGYGTLTVGDYVVTVYSGFTGTMYLDCEMQNAYFGNTNLNNYISCLEFPRLKSGSNEITWAGGISSVKIIPRWWTL